MKGGNYGGVGNFATGRDLDRDARRGGAPGRMLWRQRLLLPDIRSRRFAFGLSETVTTGLLLAVMCIPLLFAPVISVLIEQISAPQKALWGALGKLLLRTAVVIILIFAIFYAISLSWLHLPLRLDYVILLATLPAGFAFIFQIIFAIIVPHAVAFALTRTAGDGENHGGRIGLACWVGCIFCTAYFFISAMHLYANGSDDQTTNTLIFYAILAVIGAPFAWVCGGWGADARQSA